MESRKRPHEGDAPVSVKKRALSSTNDSPVTAVSPNNAGDEPQHDEEVEIFRKEAIYRRMQHYSRQVERSQQLIDELQARTLSYEASLAAIETCWDQLLQQIRALVKSGHISSDLDEPGLLQLTRKSPQETQISSAFNEALGQRESRTIEVLKSILTLPPRSSAPETQELQRTCQRLLSEVNGTKGELNLTRTRLEDAKSLAERYLEQLSVAENRVERLKSESVQRVESKMRTTATEQEKKEEPPEQNGNHVMKAEVLEMPIPTMNGHIQSFEDGTWQAKAEERATWVARLQTEVFELNQQLSKARMDLAAPSLSTLQTLKAYRQLESAVETHKRAEEIAREEAAALRDYIAQVKAERLEQQNRMQAEANAKVVDLKVMLEKRDADLTRLRDGRDALISELHEHKSKEAEREGSLAQTKILASARGERVALLVSENHRLKARLAARDGEESFLAFIMANPRDESYVRGQEERLDIVQRSMEALESTLKSISVNNPEVATALRSEAEARAKCAELQRRLDKLEAIYGSEALASASQEFRQLSTQLEKKEEEVRCLRLELKTSLAEPADLYNEIERLSGLWENLDKQLKGKIFDLMAMEDKLAKSATEKAKADNKYFATMRELDGARGVRQNQTREITKQKALIEKLAESEKSLNMQLGQLEKENQLQAKAISEREAMIATAQLQADREHGLLELTNKHVAELQEQIKERNLQISKLQKDLQIVAEEKIQIARDAKAEAKKIRESNATGADAELVAERDGYKSVVKCSTCKIHFRDHVITKCFHTFCKQCIDARLTTRQRKCPACGLPFGNGDVQQVFFQ